jgi:hypothetical protein
MNQPSYEICSRIRIPVSQEEGEIVDVFETENGDWEYTVICNDGREVTVYESEISCICLR